ncbi:hypothetical protein ABZ926_19495 [Streptomyces litmocidini]|uniref:hypothetical protein n=1 Tax=Streptomyces litmocidini TaxID=67318 RepID=UPI0033F52099
MSSLLSEDLDRRLAAEVVPQCPAPPTRRRTRTCSTQSAPVADDPSAAEHRAQLLAALSTTTSEEDHSMSTDRHDRAVPLDLILGPDLAAAVIRRAATGLQRDDLLPEHVALRLACEPKGVVFKSSGVKSNAFPL